MFNIYSISYAPIKSIIVHMYIKKERNKERQGFNRISNYINLA